MHIMLSLDGGADSAALPDLFDWLSQTRQVTYGAELALRPARASGAMSAGDAIVVAAGAVSSLSAVVQAYAAWRSTRHAPPALMVRLENGATVTVVHGSPDEAAALLRAASNSPSAQSAPTVAEEES